MTKRSLPQKTGRSPVEERGSRGRMLRGVELYCQRAADFSIYLDGTIGVSSASRADHVHHVDPETGDCTCEDHAYRGRLCLHYYAALIFVARRTRREAAAYRARVLTVPGATPARRSRCQRFAPATTRRAA